MERTPEETEDALEGVLEFLVDLHYKIKMIEDFESFGVVESILRQIEEVLEDQGALLDEGLIE